jgi:hypothetical protein
MYIKGNFKMKKLIMFLVIFIPASLIAQNNAEKDNTLMDNQLKEWMNKISSDSEMRDLMVDMMIEKTKGNKEEMSKLVNSFTGDPELNKMIMNAMPKSANSEYSLQPIGAMTDSIRMMKTQPMPKN